MDIKWTYKAWLARNCTICLLHFHPDQKPSPQPHPPMSGKQSGTPTEHTPRAFTLSRWLFHFIKRALGWGAFWLYMVLSLLFHALIITRGESEALHLSVSGSVCLSACLFVSVSVSLPLFFCLSLSLCVSVSVALFFLCVSDSCRDIQFTYTISATSKLDTTRYKSHPIHVIQKPVTVQSWQCFIHLGLVVYWSLYPGSEWWIGPVIDEVISHRGVILSSYRSVMTHGGLWWWRLHSSWHTKSLPMSRHTLLFHNREGFCPNGADTWQPIVDSKWCPIDPVKCIIYLYYCIRSSL